MVKTEKKIQSKNIELFLSLANATTIDAMSTTELTVFVMGYFDLLEAFQKQMPFLEDLSRKRQNAIVMINSSDDRGEIEKLQSVFSQLQKRVRERLEGVINAVSGESGDYTEILSSKVTYRVFADVKGDKFASVFEPDKISTELNFEAELKCIDVVMDSILVGYGKKPSQLGECEKEGCSNLFFKYTPASKFCSTRCSNAKQQAKFKRRSKAH